MPMAAQETTMLPHRLARSAKDLARASLSGVACELKDPRMAKQAGSSSQAAAASQRDGSRSGEASKPRPALYSRENSFRNQPNASASRAVEADFERFQEKDIYRNEWLSQDPNAYVKVTPGSESYHEDSFGIRNEPLAPHYLTSEATIKDAASDVIDLISSQSDTGVMNDSQRYSKVDHARAAAARRLEQIGAQIQRNLAMQVLQQDAGIEAHLVATTAMELRHESAQQAINQKPQAPQSSHPQSMSDSRQMSQHQRQTPNLDRPPTAMMEQASDEQEDSQIHFHCPYYACHQNLQRHLSGSSSSSRRLCIHAGCNEQSETSNAWNEHIALPHHDLQG
jgi:hypothetical protein